MIKAQREHGSRQSPVSPRDKNKCVNARSETTKTKRRTVKEKVNAPNIAIIVSPVLSRFVVGLTLTPKMDTDTHADLTRECMHHTPRIPSSRACCTRASNKYPID
jgi:hypothetical protein